MNPWPSTAQQRQVLETERVRIKVLRKAIARNPKQNGKPDS